MICASCKGKGTVFTLIPPVSTCNNCDGSGGFLVDMGSRPCPACGGKGLTRLTGQVQRYVLIVGAPATSVENLGSTVDGVTITFCRPRGFPML